MTLAVEALSAPKPPAAAAAVIALGTAALGPAMDLAHELRNRGLRVEVLAERGLKALLRRADKVGAHYAVIIGDDELARSVVQLRDLRASTQRELPIAELAGVLLGSDRK
jgi:histidyl-tRNA synthetase